MDFTKIGGRKFVMALVAVAAGCAMQAFTEKGLTTEAVTFLLGIVTIFSGANTLVTAKMGATPPVPQGPDPKALAEVNGKVERLAETLTTLGKNVGDVQEYLVAITQGNQG